MPSSHRTSCTHDRVLPPRHPIPDWTGFCPDCRERVKHDGRGGFVTVREVNARIAADHEALRRLEAAWREGSFGTVLGILCNVRDAAGDGLEDVDLDYIERESQRAVALLAPVLGFDSSGQKDSPA